MSTNPVSLLTKTLKMLATAVTVFGYGASSATDVARTNAAMPISGYWLTENNRAIVEFGPCDDDQRGDLCGRLAWVAEPHDAAGALKRDIENGKADLQSRPLCGLPLIGGLAAVSPETLVDGWLYSPRSGKTYSADISLVNEQNLKVRGYLGVPLLGQSQIWTRVDDARTGCPLDAG